MKSIIYIRNAVLAALILTSCNSNPKQSKADAPLPTEAVKALAITEPASCYYMIKDNDKVMLHITIINNIVTGDLVYNYFEKDKNSGTINGGKINTTTGVADLTDRSAIEFDGSTVLKKTDCGKDDHGCIGLSGSSWSVLKNNCVSLSATAIRLNPIEMKDKDEVPAYIIFSADQTQAELYLPENKVSIMLQRKGKEGNWSWEYEDLKLIQWKGYVLKKGSLAIYGGM